LHPRRPLFVPRVRPLLGCNRSAGSDRVTPTPSGSATPGSASSASSSAEPVSSGAPVVSGTPSASTTTTPAATAAPLEPATPAALTATWVGARTEKACKTQTVEVAAYQQR